MRWSNPGNSKLELRIAEIDLHWGSLEKAKSAHGAESLTLMIRGAGLEVKLCGFNSVPPTGAPQAGGFEPSKAFGRPGTEESTSSAVNSPA
jgi:hypothetical protein